MGSSTRASSGYAGRISHCAGKLSQHAFKPSSSAASYQYDERRLSHLPFLAQFIVVSLKEGMFNNANVIFRTKFVDGVSAGTRCSATLRLPTTGGAGGLRIACCVLARSAVCAAVVLAP